MGSVIKHNGELLLHATIAHIPIHMCIHSTESINWRCSGKGTYFEGGACCKVMDAMACTMNIFFHANTDVNSKKNLPVSVIHPTYKFLVYIICILMLFSTQKNLSYHYSSANTNPSWGVRMKLYLTPFKCRNESDWDVSINIPQVSVNLPEMSGEYPSSVVANQTGVSA